MFSFLLSLKQSSCAAFCSEDQLKKMADFLALLSRWNQTFNLTAIKDPQEMVTHHILDSLSIHPYLQGDRILDVGTGAGLPGIPLAILNPSHHFVLLDSQNKKICFVTQALLELKLKNVEAVHMNVENYHPAVSFDTILTRAFADLEKMLMYTQHLCGEKGLFLAMKGKFPAEELATVKEPFHIQWVKRIEISELNKERHCVAITKE